VVIRRTPAGTPATIVRNSRTQYSLAYMLLKGSTDECTYLKFTHVTLLKISVIMPRVRPAAVKDVGVLYWPIESWPYPALLETGSAANNRFGIVNVCLDNGAVHITNPTCVRSPEYDVATMVTFPPCKAGSPPVHRSEEHTSELQSLRHLVCRLLLEK